MSLQRATDDFELLLHVAEDPPRHLGGKSLALFDAFTYGYGAGLPSGTTLRYLPTPGFEEFVRERFRIPERWPEHLSTKCYINFLGTDDAGVFDFYVELCREYFAANPPAPPEPAGSTAQARDEEGNLVTLLEAVCKRPRMYFGGHRDLMECLTALLNGHIEAERAHAGASATASLLDNFQAWMNARHSWALGRPWQRIFLFQNLGEDRAVTAFWTFFEMFRKGELPDALTPVGKRLYETNSDLEGMSESERTAWKKKLNQIFYTE
jgi:hypothetical protein